MPCFLPGWCALDPAVQAAWAQAILSALAIFFAAWLPLRLEKARVARESHAAVMRARSRALAVLPFIAGMLTDVSRAISNFENGLTPGHLEDAILQVRLPEPLQAEASNLHELGIVSRDVQALVVKITVLRSQLISENIQRSTTSSSSLSDDELLLKLKDLRVSGNNVMYEFGKMFPDATGKSTSKTS